MSLGIARILTPTTGVRNRISKESRFFEVLNWDVSSREECA